MTPLEKFPKAKTLKTDNIRTLSKAERQNELNKEVERIGYVPLTPILLADAGERFAALEVLEKREKGELREDVRNYYLRVLYHRDGTETKPGDTFSYKYGIRKVHPKTQKPLTTRNKNDLARRGESTDLMVTKTLDDHRCIKVRREDAVILLVRNGIGICERERSSDGATFYGLLEEVPPWEYDELETSAKLETATKVPRDTPYEERELRRYEAPAATVLPGELDPLEANNAKLHAQAEQTIAKAKRRRNTDIG